ncbi:MAG: dephospho-CoA kinase [Candidatus Sabulitectum sp.]|nr:dephospho-CoA kinase [Candidatus Sabulitectum sp.]
MLWGITGCSGTGASTVAAVWKMLGADVCSLDKVGHRFLGKLSVKRALEAELGITGLSGMFQKEIRNQLRDKAFAQPEILKGINSVLHPRLKRWVSRSGEKLKEKRGVFVLDGALIFELGLDRYMNYLITVTDELDRVMGRLRARDGVSAETVIGRWDSQISIKEKSFRSHFEISNEDTEEKLKMKAEKFYKGVIQPMEEARWHTEQERN